jgi:alkyl hydroperoxide reductase subunit AhpC
MGKSITTPINWVKGDDVIVHPSVTNEEAKVCTPTA